MQDSSETRLTWKIMSIFFFSSLMLRGLTLWLSPVEHLGSNAKIAFLGGAEMILNGKGLMDSEYPVFIPPLYAILIAFGSWMFGHDQLTIKVLQIVADSATTCVVMLIAREILGFRTALISGGLLIVYPFSIYASTYIGSETLFTFFLSCCILFFLWATSSSRLAWYLLAGCMLGVATLIRGTTQFFPLLTPVLLALLHRTISKRVIVGYLGFCFCFALMIAPWTVRNYLVLKEIVPVALASTPFLQGSHEDFLTIEAKKGYPKYLLELKERGISAPPPGAGPVATDRYWFRAGLEKYKIRAETDPLSFIPFMLQKFGRMWYATESGRNHVIILFANLPLYIFAIVGVISLFGQRRAPQSIWILLFVIAYFALLHVISLPLFRYVLPIMPYVIVLASMGILVCFDRLKELTIWQKMSP
ncbi:MAG: glycosyltransferase family 39 protein [Nitrospira sp.]|nr:MAG: glycosyltransferase family 39 protein [Nitrospira sp.]